MLGNNLYTYCSNNPINYCDPDGQLVSMISSLLLPIIGKVAIITGVAVGGTVATVDAIANAITSNSKRNTTKQDNKTNIKRNQIFRTHQLVNIQPI